MGTVYCSAWESVRSLAFGPNLEPKHTAGVNVDSSLLHILQVALDHGKAAGIVKAHDRIVVCQKVGDSSVVKIIELD